MEHSVKTEPMVKKVYTVTLNNEEMEEILVNECTRFYEQASAFEIDTYYTEKMAEVLVKFSKNVLKSMFLSNDTTDKEDNKEVE